MVLLIDDCDIAWNSISESSPNSGWRVIPIYESELLNLAAGKFFPENNESFLVSFPSLKSSNTNELPEGLGFSLEIINTNETGQSWLVLTRKGASDFSIFKSMIVDLSNYLLSLSNTQNFLSHLLNRIRTWQEFMRKGAQPLSPESEIGLFGELTLLNSLLDTGLAPNYVINAWVGPLDHLQDFEIGTGAIEVKTTLSKQNFVAKIGSLEQLDDRLRKPLFLAGLKINQTEIDLTLPDLINKLINRINPDPEAARVFNERLLSAGYLDSHSSKYQRKFQLQKLFFAEVGENFPRIINGMISAEIKRVTYEIDIMRFEENGSDLASTLNKLGVN